MRTAAWIVGLGLVLGLQGGVLRAEAPASQDTVTLKDGRVLKGQVVEENDSKIWIEIKGVKRSYSRSFVASVDYGNGAEAAASLPEPPADPKGGSTVPSAPAGKAQGSMTADLAAHYSVPESEVVWVQRQGIMDADLPMIFFIAATAGVVPGPVVRLRLAGWDWADIEANYGLEPSGIYFVAGPWFAYPFYRGHYYGWGRHGGWGGGRGHFGWHRR
jgi:hypothetical protein